MKSTSPASPSPRPPLVEEDHNFSPDRVPDVDVVPCLLLELLRESAMARGLQQIILENAALAQTGGQKAADKLGKLVDRIHKLKLRINYHVNASEFIMEAISPLDETGITLEIPWQNRPRSVREMQCQSCKALRPPVFITDSERHTNQLAMHMRLAVSKDMEAFRADDQAPNTARAVTEADDYNFDDNNDGLMRFGVGVDYGRNDDNAIRSEILTKFADDVIKARPKGCKPQVLKQSGMGRIAEWRGVLNDLGLTRLSCRYTAQVLRSELPDVYNRIAAPLDDKGTTAVQKKLASARARFIKRFHEILPFEKLPPICVQNAERGK